MGVSVLAVGVDPPTELFLERKGFLLQDEQASSTDDLCDLVISKGCDAVLFGTRSSFRGAAVACMRNRHLTQPAIRIENGARGSPGWMRNCIDFLDCGGDNFLPGPSNPEEVAYVLNVAIRRVSSGTREEIERFEHGNERLEVNLTTKRIRLNGVPFCALTALETIILLALARCKGVLRSEDFYEEVYWSTTQYTNIVEVLICRIRKKLGPAAPLLQTRRNSGYELVGRV